MGNIQHIFRIRYKNRNERNKKDLNNELKEHQLDAKGRLWPTSFASSIGLLRPSYDNHPVRIKPLLFTDIQLSGSSSEYSESSNEWKNIYQSCKSIIKTNEKLEIEKNNDIAEEMYGASTFSKGKRGFAPNTLSHCLLGRPLLETVKNLVRVLNRQLNSSILYVGLSTSEKKLH